MLNNNIIAKSASLIEIVNPVGIVFTDELLIHQYSGIPIALEDVRGASLKKQRVYRKNLIVLLFAVLFAVASVFVVTDDYGRIILGFAAAASAYLGLRIMHYKYDMLIEKKNDRVELKIDAKLKDDAKQIIRHINKKLKGSKRNGFA